MTNYAFITRIESFLGLMAVLSEFALVLTLGKEMLHGGESEKISIKLKFQFYHFPSPFAKCGHHCFLSTEYIFGRGGWKMKEDWMTH